MNPHARDAQLMDSPNTYQRIESRIAVMQTAEKYINDKSHWMNPEHQMILEMAWNEVNCLAHEVTTAI